MIDANSDAGRTPQSARDGVDGVDADAPQIVSLSDVHGYLGAARSALKTLSDHDDYDPLVAAGENGVLHWRGGEEYVLVFNGDLIDRGPDNDGVLALVERLAAEAPPGHVRVTLGNHEWAVLCPDLVEWDQWYSGRRSDGDRRRFCAAVARGLVVAAYEGYSVTYAHAGRPEEYDPERLNRRLVAAASELRTNIGTDHDERTQRRLVEEYEDVLGLGDRGGRGLGAGVAWLDFRYLPETAPPQVVGHTRQERPVQEGAVVCENVIRANYADPGGEAVLVESPDALVSLERRYDGGVRTHEFDVPDDGKS